MNRRALVGSILASTLLSGCGIISYNFHYRLKVFVRVGRTIHEGSGVISARFSDQRGGCCGSSFPTRVSGEATAINLGELGYVFALLTRLGYRRSDGTGWGWDYAARAPVYAIARQLGDPGAWRTDVDEFPALLERVKTYPDEVALIGGELPTFARFRNLQNAGSVEFIDPSNFSGAFGDRASLQACTIQIVREPVTRTLATVLPWLPEYRQFEVRPGLLHTEMLTRP